MTSSWSRVALVVGVAVGTLAGCSFPPLPDIPADAGGDGPGVDGAPSPDAPVDAPLGAAMLTTTQAPHDFGPIVIGQASPLFQVTIRNGGEQATGQVTLSLTGTSPGEFQIVPTGDSSDCAGATLDPGATCVAQVRYQPTQDGAPSATLTATASPGGSVTVALSGEALTVAMLSTTQPPIDFGDVVTGQQTALTSVVVRNSGEQRSGTVSASLGGANAGDFQIVPTGMANDCAGALLDFQQTCVVQVRFRPTAAMTRTATLTVAATPGAAVTVNLTGDGLSPGNLVVDLPASGTLDFGTREIATGASSTPQTIRIRNSGGAATGALAVAITGGGGSYSTPTDACNGMTLGSGATCDVAVRFNPTAVGVLPTTITILDTAASTGASVNATGTGSARVQVTRTGTGTITSTPAAINCGTGCTAQTGTFTQTPISLDAVAEAGWRFTGWTGACASANPASTCSLPLTQGLSSVGATFTQVFVLTVATMPAGSGGTVTSTSPGILCGNGNTDCTETYLVNTPVELQAEPSPGFEVFGWSGTGVSCGVAARTCTVTMNQARTVTVEFRRQYTLVANVSGSGTGSVTGSFTGGGSLSCSTGNVGTCMATVFDGTTATVTRTIGSAGTDSQIVFDGWGDACTAAGAGATCNITIDGNKTASASFTLQHLVRVTFAGSGGGTVTGPAGLSCGASCTRYYDTGTPVALTAMPNASSAFVGWSGACTGATCDLGALTAPRSVTATFTPSYTVGGQVTGLWTGANGVLRLAPSGYPAQTVTMSQEGTFTFPQRVANGATFTVSVDTQPSQHTCTVVNPSGQVMSANVNNLSITCTSSIVVSVAFLGPITFAFDRQLSTQAAVDMSILQTDLRVAIDGPAGSTGMLNGAALAYQVASAPVALSLGANSVIVDFTVGAMSRRYTVPVNRGAIAPMQSLYGKAQVRDPGDYFGVAVAGWGDRIIVGAYGEDSNSATVPGNNSTSDSGAAYIMRRDGATWTQEMYLKGSNITANRNFGMAVDMSGDTAVVGANGSSVWVFRRSGTVWAEEVRLDAPESNALYGRAVAIHGDVIAVGAAYESEAPNTQNGAVYIYRRTGTTWALETTLRAPNRGDGDYFGGSVSLQQDLVAIGAAAEDSAASGTAATAATDDGRANSGAVYVFRREGGNWILESYIKASNPDSSDEFGTALSLGLGELIVGVPQESSNGLQSDNSVTAAGAAYVFRRTGTTWAQDAYLKDATPGLLDQFGNAVAIRSDAVAVGDRGNGPVHVFRRTGGSWSREPTLAASNQEAGDSYGASLDFIGEGLVVGARDEDGSPGPGDNNAAGAGACYVFR